MWILPSRSRPHKLTRLITAYRATRASTLVCVCLDDDDPLLSAYLALPLPPSWTIRTSQRRPLSMVYNDFYGACPWYGFIADDVVPETEAWDTRLVQVAGNDAMAVPAGGHDPDGAPHFVLGQNLVESAGWVALPGLSRLFIDTVWQDIATAKGVLRRVPDVVLRHHHFSNGLALMDKTYRKPSDMKRRDRCIYDAWRGA